MAKRWGCCSGGKGKGKGKGNQPSVGFGFGLAPRNDALQAFLDQEERTETLMAIEESLLTELCRAPTLPKRLVIYSKLVAVRAELAL